MGLVLKALGRLLQFGLHLSWGMALALWLRLRLGDQWHQQARGRTTICRWLGQLSHILGLHIHVSGERCSGSALLVANHISWLEIIAIGSLQPTRFLAKDDVGHWPLIGPLVTLGGTLFIRRHSNSALRRTHAELAQALAAGQSVLIFPEGTTTDGSRVEHFRPGLFEAARDAHCPIQPIAICYRRDCTTDLLAPYIDDDTFVAHLWRILQRGDTQLYLHFCTPLAPTATRQQLAQLSRESIVGALDTEPRRKTTAEFAASQNDLCAETGTPL